jgi:uncharacterized protein (UPF0333 family)
MDEKRGQLSVEMVIIAGVMMLMLFTIYFANQHLRAAWETQKQRLQAGAAANQLAIAINRAAAGGNSTKVFFTNRVGQDVVNVTIYGGRSVRAYFAQGGFYSVSLVTNNTNVSGPVPLNRGIIVANSNDTIRVYSE